MVIERHHFAVDKALGKHLGIFGDGGETISPIQTGPGANAARAVGDAHLRPIAIELHFMRPARPLRRLIDELGELRFHKTRHFRRKYRLAADARGGFGRLLGLRLWSTYTICPTRP